MKRKENLERIKKLEADETWNEFYKSLEENGKLASSGSGKRGDD
jgi:hypothetical protein